MNPNLLAFLSDLRDLCKKHNAYIDGCGCCGSPFGFVGNDAFDYLQASGFEAKAATKDGTIKVADVRNGR